MKSLLRISILALIALFLLAGCAPGLTSGDGLVLGDEYHLQSGQSLNHDLTVVGGNVTLEQNSTVNGDLAVMGGNVTVDGRINGDLTVMGGSVNLNDHAYIQGQLNSIGGSVQRSKQAVVEGNSTNNNGLPIPLPAMRAPLPQVNFDPITGPLMAIFQSLALAALAIVVTLFAPLPMDRAGRTAMAAPAAAGGVGCLTIVVLLIMTITIILIPVSVLGFLIAGIAALFGWLALGLLVGRMLAVWMKQPWSDPVNAGVGTLVVSLLASMLNIIPCIGWIAGTLVGLVALGAVILSRFGTQIYPSPYAAGPFAPRPAPYSPPVGPAPEAHIYGPESDQPRETPPSNDQP